MCLFCSLNRIIFHLWPQHLPVMLLNVTAENPLAVRWRLRDLPRYNRARRGNRTCASQDEKILNGSTFWNPSWYPVQQWLTTCPTPPLLYSKESHIQPFSLFSRSIWSLKALAVCLPLVPPTHNTWWALPGRAHCKWSGTRQQLLEGTSRGNTKLLYTWPLWACLCWQELTNKRLGFWGRGVFVLPWSGTHVDMCVAIAVIFI